MTSRLRIGAFLLALLATGGCLDTTGSFYRRTIRIPEGVVADMPLHTTIRGGAQVSNAIVLVGDDAGNIPARGTLGFDLSQIPPGIAIESATLSVRQCSVAGDPYAGLGALVVDHINLSSGVDASVYDQGTLTANIGTLSTTATLEEKNLDVTAQLRADILADRAVSGFRLRFATKDSDNDAASDAVTIGIPRDGSDCGVGSPPALVVVLRA